MTFTPCNCCVDLRLTHANKSVIMCCGGAQQDSVHEPGINGITQVLASRSLAMPRGNLSPSNSSLPQPRAPPIPHRHSRCARQASPTRRPSPTRRRHACSQRPEPGAFEHRVSGHEAQQHNLEDRNHPRQIENQPTRHTSFDTLVELSTSSVDHDTTEPLRME